MKTKLTRGIPLLVAIALGTAGPAAPARAGLVGTGQVAAPAQSERDRIKALAERPEVAKKLEMLGASPAQVEARVDALTDEEVHALAAKLDALPAGGLSDQNWLLVIIAVILVAILIAI